MADLSLLLLILYCLSLYVQKLCPIVIKSKAKCLKKEQIFSKQSKRRKITLHTFYALESILDLLEY